MSAKLTAWALLSGQTSEEDPLFNDIDHDSALNLTGTDGNRIEFLRNAIASVR